MLYRMLYRKFTISYGTDDFVELLYRMRYRMTAISRPIGYRNHSTIYITQRLLKKYYLFSKKLRPQCILWTTFFGIWALTVPIDKKRPLCELFTLLRLFELFKFFQVCREKGIQQEDWAEKRAAIADEIEDPRISHLT